MYSGSADAGPRISSAALMTTRMTGPSAELIGPDDPRAMEAVLGRDQRTTRHHRHHDQHHHDSANRVVPDDDGSGRRQQQHCQQQQEQERGQCDSRRSEVPAREPRCACANSNNNNNTVTDEGVVVVVGCSSSWRSCSSRRTQNEGGVVYDVEKQLEGAGVVRRADGGDSRSACGEECFDEAATYREAIGMRRARFALACTTWLSKLSHYCVFIGARRFFSRLLLRGVGFAFFSFFFI